MCMLTGHSYHVVTHQLQRIVHNLFTQFSFVSRESINLFSSSAMMSTFPAGAVATYHLWWEIKQQVWSHSKRERFVAAINHPNLEDYYEQTMKSDRKNNHHVKMEEFCIPYWKV